jgi:phosphoserine phosphatase RsbU/P
VATRRAGERPAGSTRDEGERRIVAGFRSRLGPPPAPHVAGIEVAHLYLPSGHEAALVGGDFIDYYGERNLRQIAVVVGDVAGKGVDAAFDALTAKIATHAIALGLSWPPLAGRAVQEAHNALIDATLRQESHITMIFALMNGRDGRFSFASAGHPLPLVLRRKAIERPLAMIGPAIGVDSGAALEPYGTETVDLDVGESVLLFTDGLAEARDAEGRFYDDVRLVEALEELRGLPAAQLLERLVADLAAFTRGPLHDDLALVALKRCASINE